MRLLALRLQVNALGQALVEQRNHVDARCFGKIVLCLKQPRWLARAGRRHGLLGGGTCRARVGPERLSGQMERKDPRPGTCAPAVRTVMRPESGMVTGAPARRTQAPSRSGVWLSTSR